MGGCLRIKAIKHGLYSLLFLFFYLPAFKTVALPGGNHPADTVQLRKHLVAVTQTGAFRNHDNIQVLNQVARYIQQTFLQFSDSVSVQQYVVEGRTYQNVICSFGTQHKKRIIVGAHYDVCGNQEGADDNASGTAGLLELARLVQNRKLNTRIDLVAYTLEEPPYFRTQHMGSYVHAQFLKKKYIPVLGMVSLEMIGYFSEEKNSQDYPVGILKAIYGNTGNYITLVKKPAAGKFVRQFCRTFKNSRAIKTKTFTAPAWIPGIDFSDHLNYWNAGYPALMITDTAFFRNKNYHESSDILATLNVPKMALVLDGVFAALMDLAG
jgi:Zn-dependent M28 family amino/carboxypeptidase